MCLVEIEGMPKLQAACTMTAGDGMKVHTRSENAADGQEAVLEFILLNHPLDCPVCDKGGECPLQDLTYRYGPGNTRFHLNKRTYEKPLAISPLIALDRERCILCYRCTRFSQDVAQDEQLVARERGATSVIATFEDEPYRGRFSGNVIELCPVGALTSTVYRFQARPWEINDIPSVCGMCAGRLQHLGHGARGRRPARSLAQPPRGRRGLAVRPGSLRPRLPGRRRPLPARAACAAPAGSSPRRPSSSPRPSRAASATTRASTAPTRSPSSPRASRPTRRPAPGPSSCARPAAAPSSAPASAPPATGTRSRPYAARIADLDRADVIVVSGEREVGDAAGVLELRVRQAVRRGARLLLAGSGGVDLDLAARSASPRATWPRTLSGAAHPVLIATDPGAVATAAATAHAAGLHSGQGGVLAVPEGPNERGLHALGYRDDPAEVLRRAEDGTLQMLVVLGDSDVLSRFPEPERWEAALQRCESVVASSLFPTPTALWAHVILPATSPLEKDGTMTNLEGRTQRLRPFVPPPDGVAPELAVLAAAGRHLELELEASAVRAFARVEAASPLFAGLSYETIGLHAPLTLSRPAPAGAPAPSRPPRSCRSRATKASTPSAAARCSPAPRSRAPSGSRSSAATRSSSPARTRSGSASPRASA